MTQITKANKGF